MANETHRRREYYRVHELLRSHTLARLRRGQPDHLRGLYRRAAAWHDDRGDHVEALRCAGLAGDVDATEVLLRLALSSSWAAGSSTPWRGPNR